MNSYVSQIDPANSALGFIDNRISYDNYRGRESSQHNRYDINELITTLNILDKYTQQEKLLRIRTTDLSERPYNLPEETNYAHFCNEVNQGANKGTQDSIRKNLFVDWHRMGFIERYNPHKIANEPFTRSITYYVSLTDMGKKLINKDTSLLEKQFLFSKGLNNLLSGFISDTLDVLNEPSINYIDFHEFMFFVSAINVPNFGITVSKCTDLILNYRRLSKFQKSAVIDTLSSQLQPKLFSGNKTNKRDFHNWQNKNQQIWHLFHEVAFFSINDSVSPEKLYSISIDTKTQVYDKRNMKRSKNAKLDYFNNHNITKTLGFELDHIIPLLTANSVDEFAYLDDWKNLLYIDGKTHAIKSQTGSKFSLLEYNPHEPSIIYLKDFQFQTLTINQGKEGLFNPDLVKTMKEYNAGFLTE